MTVLMVTRSTHPVNLLFLNSYSASSRDVWQLSNRYQSSQTSLTYFCIIWLVRRLCTYWNVLLRKQSNYLTNIVVRIVENQLKSFTFAVTTLHGTYLTSVTLTYPSERLQRRRMLSRVKRSALWLISNDKMFP